MHKPEVNNWYSIVVDTWKEGRYGYARCLGHYTLGDRVWYVFETETQDLDYGVNMSSTSPQVKSTVYRFYSDLGVFSPNFTHYYVRLESQVIPPTSLKGQITKLNNYYE